MEEEANSDTCPRCGGHGSYQDKWVKNKAGDKYTYRYFAHYAGLKGTTRKISWCYVGKGAPKKETPAVV